jgi:acetyl-CoA acyltransferase
VNQAVIAGYVRSPFTLAGKGALAHTRPDDLAAAVVAELVKRTGVKPEDIEALVLGCAFPEGEQGLNVARLITLLAGLPQSVAGYTVNQFCGSSMQAVHIAAGHIATGAGEVFIAGGVESMSRVPMPGFNIMPNPKLAKEVPGAYMGMGQTAENVAAKWKISRETQDAFALRSQERTAKAQAAGYFADEIVPITTRNGVVDKDGCPRPDSNAASLAGLKPVFDTAGSVTAATSSPLTDGATAVLVCSADYAAKHGLKVLAKIVSSASAGCAPEIMGIGPVAATKKALKRAGLEIGQIDIVELNEAFASQSLACVQELGIKDETLNIDGGAIALGHPLGATGARLVGKAASLLARTGKRYALATQCIGGGQGIATILERV